LILCQCVNDLPANPGGMLLAAIYENNNAQLPLRGEPYVSLRVIQPAVLIDDSEVAGADNLPGETYC